MTVCFKKGETNVSQHLFLKNPKERMKVAAVFFLGIACLTSGYRHGGAGGYYQGQYERNLGYVTSQLAYNLLSYGTQQQNTVYSPLAISASLSMIYGGARGQAAQEISKALGYDRYGLQENVHQAYRDYLNRYYGYHGYDGYDDFYGVYVQQGYTVQETYTRLVQSYYQTPISYVDFAAGGHQVREQINDRVRRTLGSHYGYYLEHDLDPQTELYYMSAAYYNQTLEIEGHYQTYPGYFYNWGEYSRQSRPATMAQVRARLPYYYTQEYKAVQIPYHGEGDINLLLVVPEQPDGLRQLQQYFTPQAFHQMLSRFQESYVEVEFPHFRLNRYYDLSDYLEKMGIEAVFDNSGDISGISPSSDFSLSQVDHRAVVEVDKFTYVQSQEYHDSYYPHQVKADHPFLFYILDSQYEVVLFAGYIGHL